MRREVERLRDILEAIKRIEAKMVSERAAFDDDEMLQIWVLHHLQIIGEAVNQLDEDIQRQYPEAPWRAIIGLRHILVHQYFDIDLDIIWKVAGEELPALKAQVQKILKEMQT
jgi:uncharacterized protein with HEPN domain